MSKKIFTLNEEQKQDMYQSILYFISQIKNPNTKKLYQERIQDDDFVELLIYSFAQISFLSQSLITSIKMLFDFNVIYTSILDSSKNDIFEVQELKTFILNQLSNDYIRREQIDPELTASQFKNYKNKISEFKKDYLNLFE